VKHSIVFKNTDNHWDNGLPLGNGCFGAMVYFEKGRLFMPMNHYEVYYNKEENVLPEDMLAAMKPCTDPGGLQRKFTERADMGQPPEGEAYTCYRTPRAAFDDREGTAGNILGSHPKTGDLIFSFGEKLYLVCRFTSASNQQYMGCLVIEIDQQHLFSGLDEMLKNTSYGLNVHLPANMSQNALFSSDYSGTDNGSDPLMELTSDYSQWVYQLQIPQGTEFSFAAYVGTLERQEAEKLTALIVDEQNVVEPEKTALDCLKRLKKVECEEKISGLQQELKRTDISDQE